MDEKLRLSDHHSQVSSQCAKKIMKDRAKISLVNSLFKCVGIPSKLEIQGRNAPHRHIPLFLKGVVIDYVCRINEILSTELLIHEQNRELLAFVKSSIYITTLSTGKASCGTFSVYLDMTQMESNGVTPGTFVDETFNHLLYKNSTKENRKSVTYRQPLIKKHQSYINVKKPRLVELSPTL